MKSNRRRLSIPAATLVALAVLTFSLTLLLAVRFGWHPVLAYLVSINVFAFLAYAYDKWAASRDILRIPETTLHVAAALGGTPAAFLAQRLFRHKTQKRSFRARFWLIAVAQIVVLSALIGWSRHRLP